MTIHRCVDGVSEGENENNETHSLSSVSSSIIIRSVTSGMWCELQKE